MTGFVIEMERLEINITTIKLLSISLQCYTIVTQVSLTFILFRVVILNLPLETEFYLNYFNLTYIQYRRDSINWPAIFHTSVHKLLYTGLTGLPMTNGCGAYLLMPVDHFLVELIEGHFAGKIAGQFVESLQYVSLNCI